ncbi:MAG: DUF1569 domain-containing protein [Flavobacteriales bacterium]|nr:DUF1569 domain-containing protein [Flavobacteriales bacterium]
MPSVYNKIDNDAFIARINSLSKESQPLWGKMTVEQMLSHCQAPIDLALGDLQMRSNFIMRLMGKLFKTKILNSGEFKKNSPTAPDFIRKDEYDFESTKAELIRKFSTFADLGHQSIKSNKHPFFGEMSYDEWDKLHFMHLDHHLRQFGV